MMLPGLLLVAAAFRPKNHSYHVKGRGAGGTRKRNVQFFPGLASDTTPSKFASFNALIVFSELSTLQKKTVQYIKKTRLLLGFAVVVANNTVIGSVASLDGLGNALLTGLEIGHIHLLPQSVTSRCIRRQKIACFRGRWNFCRLAVAHSVFCSLPATTKKNLVKPKKRNKKNLCALEQEYRLSF